MLGAVRKNTPPKAMTRTTVGARTVTRAVLTGYSFRAPAEDQVMLSERQRDDARSPAAQDLRRREIDLLRHGRRHIGGDVESPGQLNAIRGTAALYCVEQPDLAR